jgi:ATP-binding cassette subfamily F protein uup
VPAVDKTEKNVKEKTVSEKKKLSYKEQKELERLEQDLPRLEQRKSEIMKAFEQPAPGQDIQQLSAEMETVMAELGEKELRWLELSELM